MLNISTTTCENPVSGGNVNSQLLLCTSGSITLTIPDSKHPKRQKSEKKKPVSGSLYVSVRNTSYIRNFGDTMQYYEIIGASQFWFYCHGPAFNLPVFLLELQLKTDTMVSKWVQHK
jgi:hypothetical protein